MKQEQFLEVLDRDDAEARWHAALNLDALDSEVIALSDAHGRTLADDVTTPLDVPSFDRSNMDGFAVRAEDTYGATEETPRRLHLNLETLATGVVPQQEVKPGTATTIATGAMLPRGADAVVPVEFTDVEADNQLVVRRERVPGAAVSFAGTDMGAGEMVLFAGTRLTSRETGVLSAIGAHEIAAVRKPRVAVISTGDEIIPPGESMRPGMVYDSNSRILIDALRELGAEPVFKGIFRDDLHALHEAAREAVSDCDLVLLSGGTSKGEGDLNYRVIADFDPGILVHGVALKPGKPICLAAHHGRPIVILPGFPTSAIFTFHEFVAPVIRRFLGQPMEHRASLRARLALRVNSERGRLEYLLVGLVHADDGSLIAYPMGKGSGSVTSFSRADGFVRCERNVEIVDEGTEADVTLMGHALRPADLVIIGSHCTGLDMIARRLVRSGLSVKLLAVGSSAGIDAAKRGECDIAPVHLLDAETDTYNRPFLSVELKLCDGYTRMQGVVTRADETRETRALIEDPNLRMVNRNRGSGTRLLIDSLLGDRRPDGYVYEPRSHHAVAAAIRQRRADWGVTIESVARASGLEFRPLREECYDFVIPVARWDRSAVLKFRRLLAEDSVLRADLESAGFTPRSR